MAEPLNEVERRVLGVLMEKALTHPQYYPMSTNAIVTGCNQKSNRDPVMSLDEEAVWNALEVMRAGGLVARLLPGGASRVERFKHEVKEFFGWEKPQRAVMAELLLRGLQTVGELRSRCLRMYPFESVEAVSAVLDTLSQADPPLVTTLPRGPGQSAVRFGHQLYYPEEWASLAQSPSVAAATVSAPVPSASAPSAPASAELAALREQLEGLQGEVAELHQSVAELRQRLARLEG